MWTVLCLQDRRRLNLVKLVKWNITFYDVPAGFFEVLIFILLCLLSLSMELHIMLGAICVSWSFCQQGYPIKKYYVFENKELIYLCKILHNLNEWQIGSLFYLCIVFHKSLFTTWGIVFKTWFSKRCLTCLLTFTENCYLEKCNKETKTQFW